MPQQADPQPIKLLARDLGPAPPIDQLRSHEVFWRDHQPWLEQAGYMLRPRYRPGWKASWLGTDKRPEDCEDSLIVTVSKCLIIVVEW